MIDSKQLMLGDYFQTTYPSGSVEYRKVTSIYENGYVSCKECVTNAIEPIPLTPEILEKNGFKPIYVDKSAYLYKEIGDEDGEYDSVTIDLTQPKCCSVYSLKSKKKYEGSIVHVHDLQHALRLCGIKGKEIEL